MVKIITNFHITDLPNIPRNKTALLISPPVYDTQYWSQWSQPYGLLRIASLLKKEDYRRVELFDFMEVSIGEKIHRHRINVGESYAERYQPSNNRVPYIVSKPGDQNGLVLYKYHFGKSWEDFDEWLEDKGFNAKKPPTEIWISTIMTYWWESTRDLIQRLRNKLGKRPRIILGGIYPTLSPQHAAEFCKPDLIVTGEITEANNLWIDLSLYDTPPSYAIITPSRGCPFNCSYCAQKTINVGRTKVEVRPIDDVFNEMLYNYEQYGIRDFTFYADFLLWKFKDYFVPLLEKIAAMSNPKFRLYAPEGFDVKILSQSQELVDLMKAANFQKIYLPCESIDDEFVEALNRKHVKLEHFVKAVKMCERAGFKLRQMDINAFVLYGLPGESVDQVVRTIIFVSEIVGSIIPMLFTPVPSTRLYQKYLPFIKERRWDKELHMLNGKLFPFIEMNEGSINDYVEMQRLMFMLNSHYRSKSFQIFGETKVAGAFRENISNGFSDFIDSYRSSSEQFILPTKINGGNEKELIKFPELISFDEVTTQKVNNY